MKEVAQSRVEGESAAPSSVVLFYYEAVVVVEAETALSNFAALAGSEPRLNPIRLRLGSGKN